jgi:hypothetical protein
MDVKLWLTVGAAVVLLLGVAVLVVIRKLKSMRSKKQATVTGPAVVPPTTGPAPTVQPPAPTPSGTPSPTPAVSAKESTWSVVKTLLGIVGAVTATIWCYNSVTSIVWVADRSSVAVMPIQNVATAEQPASRVITLVALPDSWVEQDCSGVKSFTWKTLDNGPLWIQADDKPAELKKLGDPVIDSRGVSKLRFKSGITNQIRIKITLVD